MSIQNNTLSGVAFSGYRTSKILYSNNNPQIIKSIELQLLRTIESLIDKGFRHFISGGATGFDTLAALAVLRLKRSHPSISLTLALPFADHGSTFSPRQSAELATIKDGADDIVYVAQEYHDHAYLDRNDFMLRNSSTLVCYYDGQRGGTMYTVNRALKSSHTIINLCEGYAIENSDPQLRLF